MATWTLRKNNDKVVSFSTLFLMFTLTWITEKELERGIENKRDEFCRNKNMKAAVRQWEMLAGSKERRVPRLPNFVPVGRSFVSLERSFASTKRNFVSAKRNIVWTRRNFAFTKRNFVFQEFVADYRITVIITSCKSTGTCKRDHYCKKKHRNDCYNCGEVLRQNGAFWLVTFFYFFFNIILF